MRGSGSGKAEFKGQGSTSKEQGKAVLLEIRPAGLEPLDVRSFEGDYAKKAFHR
jgi:hypothetical protein